MHSKNIIKRCTILYVLCKQIIPILFLMTKIFSLLAKRDTHTILILSQQHHNILLQYCLDTMVVWSSCILFYFRMCVRKFCLFVCWNAHEEQGHYPWTLKLCNDSHVWIFDKMSIKWKLNIILLFYYMNPSNILYFIEEEY